MTVYHMLTVSTVSYTMRLYSLFCYKNYILWFHAFIGSNIFSFRSKKNGDCLFSFSSFFRYGISHFIADCFMNLELWHLLRYLHSNKAFYAQHLTLKSVFEYNQSAMSSKLFSSYKTNVIKLAQVLWDFKISDRNCL